MEKVVEDGIIAGNYFDKYNTKNPISRWMINQFHKVFQELILNIAHDISSISEVGCGEGHLTSMISRIINVPIKACDFSSQIIEIARNNNPYHNISFYVKNIYDISPEGEGGDLIICSEVLEHLDKPELALQKLNAVTNQYILLSVPNEPLWRILNVMRGKYLKSFGNTPGHIQHWSCNSFKKIVAKNMQVIKIKKSLPWLILLCKKV